jgi:hypothetical protein
MAQFGAWQADDFLSANFMLLLTVLNTLLPLSMRWDELRESGYTQPERKGTQVRCGF